MLAGELALDVGDFHLDSGPFELETDGVSVLFGRSGAGKSTLLRALAGLDRRTRGRLRFQGETWQDGRRSLPVERRDIGFVFQGAALLPHRSVAGNLAFARRRVPASRRQGPEPGEVVEQLGISHLMDRAVTHLSGGERQRVAIARALVSRPRLLMMDEPLAALDWRARGEILRLVERVVHSFAIPTLYITHAPGEVERLARRVVFMEHGRITAVQTLAQALGRVDSPLFQEEGPVSVLRGQLGAPEADGISPLTSGPVTLWVTPPAGPLPAQPARLRVLARDVALSRRALRDISTLNQLPAWITAVEDATTPGRQVVFLELADGQSLLAEVTGRSARTLGLAPGQPTYALIKTVALLD